MSDDRPGGVEEPATSDPRGEGEGVPPEERAPVAYEIFYECRDKMLGARLAHRLEEVLGPTYEVRRTEDGPAWAVTIVFPSRRSADRFFDSDFYKQFCIEARRSCRSAVLVVPLGEVPS